MFHLRDVDSVCTRSYAKVTNIPPYFQVTGSTIQLWWFWFWSQASFKPPECQCDYHSCWCHECRHMGCGGCHQECNQCSSQPTNSWTWNMAVGLRGEGLERELWIGRCWAGWHDQRKRLNRCYNQDYWRFRCFCLLIWMQKFSMTIVKSCCHQSVWWWTQEKRLILQAYRLVFWLLYDTVAIPVLIFFFTTEESVTSILWYYSFYSYLHSCFLVVVHRVLYSTCSICMREKLVKEMNSVSRLLLC